MFLNYVLILDDKDENIGKQINTKPCNLQVFIKIDFFSKNKKLNN